MLTDMRRKFLFRFFALFFFFFKLKIAHARSKKKYKLLLFENLLLIQFLLLKIPGLVFLHIHRLCL